MAKPELFAHVKLGRLVRALACRRYEAVGILESLWHHCYSCASDAVGTAADLAWIVDWPTERADELAAALELAGFLDPDLARPGAWRAHDLWRHAPQYARRRRANELEAADKKQGKLSTEPKLEFRSAPDPYRTDPKEKDSGAQAPPAPAQAFDGLEPAGTAPDESIVAPGAAQAAGDAAVVNERVLARLVYELAPDECATWHDAADALKGQAARYRVPYTGDAVTRAIVKVGYARASSPTAGLVRRRGVG